MKKILLLSLIIAIFSFKYSGKYFKKDIALKYVDIDRPMQGDKDNPYAAQEFRYNMLKGNKPYLDPLARQRAINYTKKHLLQKNPANTQIISSWTSIGPGNIGGRIRAILIRPLHPNTLLIGAVSGGVWKTTNGGASWFPTMDNDNPLAIGCMVNRGDTVYAGTGEGWGNVDAVYGGGIYKSTDFGDTWALLSSTATSNPLSSTSWNFKNVLKLAFDPNGNLYAVTKAINYKDGVGKYYTNGGLFQSTDGGTSWSKISSKSVTNYYNGCDVIPITSSTILYATQGGGIFKTTNGGTNWLHITSGLPSSFDRISMAQDPNSSNTVYAVFSEYNTSTGLAGIYKSIDGGSNWSALSPPGTIASTGNTSYLGGQGWYDNTIAVDPKNSNNIYVGGVDMMKSTDGGSNWFQLTYWNTYYGHPYVHADHHATTFDTTQINVLYDGNDGGIYKTTDGGANWDTLNNSLSITQFYGGCAYPTGNIFLGGTQDNGHLSYDGSNSNWTEVVGGDGGYAAINQSNSNYAYEEYVYLQIAKTINGNNWNNAVNGLSDAGSGSKCLFIAPFSMNPENSSVLIAGSDNIWLTTNSAGKWDSSYTTLVSGQLISAVTVVNSASPFLGFAGLTNGQIFKCTSLTGSSGDVWADITPTAGNGVQNNGAYVRRIVVDLNNKQHIYACYSGYNDDGVTPTRHVLYSSDQGTSWTDISGDLPDVPVHSLAIDSYNSQVLYIGTETGVYQTTNGGTNWVNTTAGMANYVPVDELVKQTGTDNILAFTHGRGVFITTIPLPVELTNFTSNVENDKVNLKWQTETESNNYGFEVERSPSSTIPRQDVWKKIGFVKGSGNSNSLKNYSFMDSNPVGGSNFSYRIKQIDNDGSFKYSKVLSVKVTPSQFSLDQNYPNPFNPTTTIKYSLPTRDRIEIKLYNITGKEVASLVDKVQEAGIYSVQFNGSNFASGVYFYRLTTSKSSLIKKMILLK